MGPAIRMQKNSNAPRSVSVIENDSMEGGGDGDGVATCDPYGLTLSACEEAVPREASSSLFVEGLLDAGKSGRDVTRLPDGNMS